jgi:hypothetical protein
VLNIAEIGDIDRFPTARDLCSWAGMRVCPMKCVWSG